MPRVPEPRLGRQALWRIWLAAVGFLGPAAVVEAGEITVRTDRPDRSSALDTIPPGLAQIEAGVAYGRDASEGQPVRRFTIEGNVRIGVTENFEIAAPSDLFIRERGGGQGNSGLGDVVLVGKWRLVDAEGWRPDMGVLPFVKFPTASRTKGLGTGRLDFGGIAAAGMDLTAALHVDLNFGLTAISLDETPGGLFLQKSAAASFSWAVSDWFSPFWEFFYASRDKPTGRYGVGTDFGIIFTVSQRVALDVSAEFRLAGASPDWVLRGGFAVLLGSLPQNGPGSGGLRAPPVEASPGRLAHGTAAP